MKYLTVFLALLLGLLLPAQGLSAQGFPAQGLPAQGVSAMGQSPGAIEARLVSASRVIASGSETQLTLTVTVLEDTTIDARMEDE